MSCIEGIKVIEDIIEEPKPDDNTFLIGMTLLSVGVIGFYLQSKK